MVEGEVAYHLGKVSREFQDGTLCEDCVFNADETHFVIDTHDGHTLAMKGDETVKFAQVVSGDEGMKMMVMLGGCHRSHLEVPMIVFQNKTCSYPIRGLHDDYPGVFYRTGPKG